MKKIVGLIQQDTAVGFYRLVQPLRFMKRGKFAEDARMTFFSGDNKYGEYKGKLAFPEKFMGKLCKGSDVIWSNFTASRDNMLKMLDIRKWTGGKLIIDVDDNLYSATPDNPAGEKAGKIIREIELSLKIADGVTVSVPSLKDLYAPQNDNIYVKPNGIDLSIFDKLQVKTHKGIRIGWEGAYGHRNDLEIVYPAMKQLIKDYGITFVVMGASPKEGLAQPGFPVEWNNWVPFGGENDDHTLKYPYYEKIADLGLDIIVAPLIDSSYNRCKSNLRILEHSALKIPAVASPTENQKNLPCLYAESNWEWYDSLEKLIKSAALRKKQGQLQYEFVKKNYDESSLVKPLTKWMEELPRRKDLEP